MTAGSSRFRLGINCSPPDLAMYWWKCFEEFLESGEPPHVRMTAFELQVHAE